MYRGEKTKTASCREGCACVGKGEHNRIAPFMTDYPVETFFCIHDLASIAAVDSVDQTVRTQ